MTKEEFLKISSCAELRERKKELEGLKLDKEMRLHAMGLFPKVASTEEELFKTPPVKGKKREIGR